MSAPIRSIVAIFVDDGIVHVALDDGVVGYFREETPRPGSGIDGLGRGRWIMLPPVPGTAAYAGEDL